MSVHEPINDAESKKATQSVTGAYALSLHLQEMYETINVDKTNPLTAAELKAASGEASLTANQKASAKFLLDHFDTIASLSDPEATDQTIDPDDLKEVRLKAVNFYSTILIPLLLCQTQKLQIKPLTQMISKKCGSKR